ncbi:MAG: hypothetical protein WCP18_02680 [bacterium]
MRIEEEIITPIQNTTTNFNSAPIKQGGGCRRFLVAVFLAFTVIIVAVYVLIKLAIGPVIQIVDAVPADFPQELSWLDFNKATISVQPEQAREKILNILKLVPDQALGWLANSSAFRSKILASFQDKIQLPADFSVADLKKTLASTDLSQVKTVSLSWDSMQGAKESIESLYKQELAKNGFQYKENLGDYNIDLSFWKDDVFGFAVFNDINQITTSSQIKMVVNYLKDNIVPKLYPPESYPSSTDSLIEPITSSTVQ